MDRGARGRVSKHSRTLTASASIMQLSAQTVPQGHECDKVEPFSPPCALLVERLSHRCNGVGGIPSQHANELVRSALQHMTDNLVEVDGVIALAKRFGVSTRHFNRLFQSCVGMAPSTALRRLRLARAAEMLCASTFTATQIAYACGFSDAAHMGRLFLRAYELTPIAYRRAASTHAHAPPSNQHG